MMSDKVPPVGRDRPFPWRCTECKVKAVFLQATDYTTTAKHDGRVYTIRVPDLAIPTCRQCGAQTFSVGDDDRIIEALRAQIGLLTPQEMLKRRGQLGMTQQELAGIIRRQSIWHDRHGAARGSERGLEHWDAFLRESLRV